jgi:hypothetical protein
MLALLAVAPIAFTGCWWSSDCDGNYSVKVVNDTDDSITVDYQHSDCCCDVRLTESVSIRIGETDSALIEVTDEFYDAHIHVTYNGETVEYDIDPDYWGYDRVVVRLEDFEHAN